MALSIFEEQSQCPQPNELTRTLRPSAGLWRRLITSIDKTHGPIDQVWHFAGAKYGWSLRLKRKDRTVLYLIPQKGHFLIGVVLGEKAVKTAHQSDLPKAILEEIDNARPYAEGRGIRMPIKTADDLTVVCKLVAAKMAH